MALRRLASGGVEFRHGDVRNPQDLADKGHLDLPVECSAEPSAQAGLYAGERYLVNMNLIGTITFLEHARTLLEHARAPTRRHCRFWSTSRAYRIVDLCDSRREPMLHNELSQPGDASAMSTHRCRIYDGGLSLLGNVISCANGSNRETTLRIPGEVARESAMMSRSIPI